MEAEKVRKNLGVCLNMAALLFGPKTLEAAKKTVDTKLWHKDSAELQTVMKSMAHELYFFTDPIKPYFSELPLAGPGQ